ncbi:hypothetical protein HDV63DRAFT_416447 [Trichoderma sp. SZMC 28014]
MSDRPPTEESLEELPDYEWGYAVSEHSVAMWPCEVDEENEPEEDESSSAATSATCEAATEEEPEGKESSFAKLIMEDLAAGPALKCQVWKDALKTLDEMRPSQRTPRALLTLLQSAIRDETEAWANLIAMSGSLHIESIQKLDFTEQVWTCVRHLAGHPEPHRPWSTWYEDRCPEWLDLKEIVGTLDGISIRIKDACFVNLSPCCYDIPRGIKRYESLWKCVVEALEEGRKGARMQAYVDALLESSSLPSLYD